MIKGSIQEEDIIIVNIYAPNIGETQYIKKMLTAIKGEINSSTVIVGNFNTPLIPIGRSSRQKINKETQALNDILNQMNLSVIYRAFHLKAAEYTSSSSAHRAFYRIGHMLGHKASFDKFKKTEITLSIFSNHNTMRLEVNYKNKTL